MKAAPLSFLGFFVLGFMGALFLYGVFIIPGKDAAILALQTQKDAGDSSTASSKQPIPDTKLILFFDGTGQLPKDNGENKNVYRWLALASHFITMDEKGNKVDMVSWSIFVTFIHELNGAGRWPDVTVDTSEPKPKYEIKQFDNRSIVVVILGEMPRGYVDINLPAPI